MINNAKLIVKSNQLFPLGCSLHCNNSKCDDTGFCTKGCISGFWGATCNFVCPVNCKEDFCERQNGSCASCEKGNWGDVCDKTCQGHCVGSECEQESGLCSAGCEENWTGDRCDSK